MLESVPWSLCGAGGRGRPPRFACTAARRAAGALLLAAAVLAALPAAAAPAPRLRALLKSARLAVAGEVSATTPYDEDRVAVVALRADTLLKGRLDPLPATLSLAELHEGATTAPLAAGARGLFFLRPAARTSYLSRTLPAGSYWMLVPEHGAFVAASDAADADRQRAIMAQVMRMAGGATLPAAQLRQLTFELLDAGSPVLVEDGIAGLADLDRSTPLAETEAAVLRRALQREDLPVRVRVALIGAVADARLTAMVPTLQELASPPPVLEAAWRALDALGAGPSEDTLKDTLASADADARRSAARQLLARDGAQAVAAVTPLALRDPDPDVRLAVVEALGTLRDPAALPPLEQVFVDPSIRLRQASARGILAVGGQPAIDTLTRLATTGPVTAQRYAVLLLITLDDPRAQPALDRFAETHPDEQTRELIEHGLDTGHHH